MNTKICNRAQIKYRSDSDGQQHIISTPPCNSKLTTTDVSVQIMVSKSYAELQEQFFYTFVFHNASPYTLTNVVCHDHLNEVLTYVKNSLIYNGVSMEETEFRDHVELPDLPPNGFGVLQFKVFSTKLPDPDTILNSYSLTYNSIFTDSSITPMTEPPELHSAELHTAEMNPAPTDILYSNIVEVCLGNCSLSIEHIPDRQTLIKGSRVFIHGIITNTGSNTLINNYVELNFPDGTSFLPNSLYVNDDLIPLTKENTFQIGTLHPDDSRVFTYTLQVDEEYPDGDLTATAVAFGINSDQRSNKRTITSNQVTNQFTITPSPSILEGVIANLSASCCSVEYGDSFTYSIFINNPYRDPIRRLCLIDQLPDEVYYVPNSMMINDSNLLLPILPAQLPLPDLPPHKNHKITFQVMLHSLPNTLSIDNFYTLYYEYLGSALPEYRSIQSNTLTLSTTCYHLQLKHTPDHFIISAHDTLYYTGTVSNLSTDNCLSTYISFQFPAGASVILDSVILDHKPACFTFQNELFLGDLLSGESVTFCYSLHLSTLSKDSFIDSAVAYGRASEACSTHPAILSNTEVNHFHHARRTLF